MVAEELMKGKTNEINEDIPKEYQIEYLPYDRQWEFPRHRLKLGSLHFRFLLFQENKAANTHI